MSLLTSHAQPTGTRHAAHTGSCHLAVTRDATQCVCGPSGLRERRCPRRSGPREPPAPQSHGHCPRGRDSGSLHASPGGSRSHAQARVASVLCCAVGFRGAGAAERRTERPALPNSSEEKQAPRGASTRPSASGAAGGARSALARAPSRDGRCHPPRCPQPLPPPARLRGRRAVWTNAAGAATPQVPPVADADPSATTIPHEKDCSAQGR